jgi:hypothetical protein
LVARGLLPLRVKLLLTPVPLVKLMPLNWVPAAKSLVVVVCVAPPKVRILLATGRVSPVQLVALVHLPLPAPPSQVDCPWAEGSAMSRLAVASPRRSLVETMERVEGMGVLMGAIGWVDLTSNASGQVLGVV